MPKQIFQTTIFDGVSGGGVFGRYILTSLGKNVIDVDYKNEDEAQTVMT